MKADVIVVLGAAVWPNEKPSPSLLRRVKKSIDLYKSGHAENIIMSGGVGRHPPAEAVVMKRIALESGIPEERILIDDRSTNTYESAINCSAIMNNNNWVKLIVVSDSYHLIRSVLLFNAFGKYAKGIKSDHGKGDTKLWKWIFYHLREVVALPWYAIKIAAQIYFGSQLPDKKSNGHDNSSG